MEEVKRPLKNRIFTWVVAVLVLLALFSPALAALVVPVYMAVQTGSFWWVFGMALVIPFVLMGSAGLKKVNSYLEGLLTKRMGFDENGGMDENLKKKVRQAIRNRIASSDTDFIEVNHIIKAALRDVPRVEFVYKG